MRSSATPVRRQAREKSSSTVGKVPCTGRVDVLHNNVGISVAGGDAGPLDITCEAFDLIMTVNLRGTIMA